VLDHPVVVLVEETENGSKVLRLLLHEVVEDIVLSPLDFFVAIKIIGLQKFLFDLSSVEILQMFGIGSSLDVSCTFFHHLEHYVI